MIEHWLEEHPHLIEHRTTLRRQIRSLDQNPAFVEMMYGRDVIPHSRERMAACPELRGLLEFLDSPAGCETSQELGVSPEPQEID